MTGASQAEDEASQPRRPDRAGIGPHLAVFGLGSALTAILAAVHLSQGSAEIPLGTIVDAIVDHQPRLHHEIVRHLRLPRLVAGLIAGALLAVAGLLLQTATRNPLAAPATLGVNAGAFLAVVAAAALAPGFAAASPLSVAFLGGLGAAALVVAVAGGLSATPVRLALAGMAVAMALAAGAAVLQILFEEETAGLFFWGSGTLIQDGWDAIGYTLPRALPALGVALLMSRSLDVLSLGDDTASSLGQRVDVVRVGATLLAVLMAASAVSLTGPIGFVGLVAPHLVRLMGLKRHLPRILGSIVWGPTLIVGADVVGRWITPGLSELPAGVITALIGTPFLIHLARRTGRDDQRAPAPADRRVRGPDSRRRLPLAWTLAGSGVALSAAVGFGLSLGAVDIPASALLDVLAGAGTSSHRFILLELRLPRVLVAALAGGCLATSGLLLQGVVRNPLAAPDLVGVMSGAGVGAMLLLLVVPGAPAALVPVAAFIGAVGAFAIVYVAAWRDGVSPERLALVGIGVAALGAAIINVLVVRSDVRLAQALVWLSGSTYAQGYSDLVGLGLWAGVLVPLAWVSARQLDLLGLGDDAARGLGLPVERVRLVQLSLAVALAAVAVATVGTVGFVGLVAPHAARLLVGGRHRRLVPVALLLGAVLLVSADLIGRILLAPKQIPSGLVVAVLGAPYFVWLLRRRARS